MEDGLGSTVSGGRALEPWKVRSWVSPVKTDGVHATIKKPSVIGMLGGMSEIGHGVRTIRSLGIPPVYRVAEQSDQIPFEGKHAAVENLLPSTLVEGGRRRKLGRDVQAGGPFEQERKGSWPMTGISVVLQGPVEKVVQLAAQFLPAQVDDRTHQLLHQALPEMWGAEPVAAQTVVSVVLPRWCQEVERNARLAQYCLKTVQHTRVTVDEGRAVVAAVVAVAQLRKRVGDINVIPWVGLDPAAYILAIQQALGLEPAGYRAEHIGGSVNTMFHNMLEYLELPPFRMGIAAEVEGLETVDQAILAGGIDLILEEADLHDVVFQCQRYILCEDH